MDFQGAVTKAIREYFADKQPAEYKKQVGSRKMRRNKKYFDGLETELLGKEEAMESEDNLMEELDERDA